jgi:putative transposase
MAEQAQFSKQYHCVYALHYHLVMCTKYRKKCIDAAMLARVREIVATRCTGWGGSLLAFNGEGDHVHLLLALPPNLDLSRFVNNLKTTSSRLLRKEFADRLKRVYRKPVFWSRSYCIITCGGAPLSILKQYIEQQPSPE